MPRSVKGQNSKGVLPHFKHYERFNYVDGQILKLIIMKIIKTSLNWSHNGSKNYTIDSLNRNRCQRPLTNCHTAETARK